MIRKDITKKCLDQGDIICRQILSDIYSFLFTHLKSFCYVKLQKLCN